MVELFGWATLRESFEKDSDGYKMPNIEKQIRSKIEAFEWSNGILHLDYLNGDLTLSLAIKANRVRQETEDVFELYGMIASIAKGSYGLLYMHDDENVTKDNEFQVFVLSRGNIREEKDSFLSPRIPIIED